MRQIFHITLVVHGLNIDIFVGLFHQHFLKRRSLELFINVLTPLFVRVWRKHVQQPFVFIHLISTHLVLRNIG